MHPDYGDEGRDERMGKNLNQWRMRVKKSLKVEQGRGKYHFGFFCPDQLRIFLIPRNLSVFLATLLNTSQGAEIDLARSHEN